MGSALGLVLGLVSSTAMAKDVDLGKHSENEIKSICGRVGGNFVSDGQTYGCAKKCTGGTCAVICDKDDGCIGTTPGDRRRGPTGERGVLDALSATASSSQSDLPKLEVGGQFSMLHFDTFSAFSDRRRMEFGGGGRFTFNFNQHVAAEAQVDYFPHTDTERIGTFDVPLWGSKTLAVFGIKAGGRSKRVGVFGKARPGFIHFDSVPGFGCVVGSTSCPPPIKQTVFALDLGGVLEYYPSPKTVLRFDAGDTIIYHDKRQNFFDTSHSLQMSVGVGLRF